MGCKASKNAGVDGGGARPSKTLDTEKEGAQSPTAVPPRSRARQSPLHGATTSTAGGGVSKNRSDESNSGLYNLIVQAQQQSQQQVAASFASSSSADTGPSPSSSSKAAAAASQSQPSRNTNAVVLERIVQKCQRHPRLALYQNPVSGATPLHQACRLLDDYPDAASGQVTAIIEQLLQANPEAVRIMDKQGHVPLHYAVAPATTTNNTTTTTTHNGSSISEHAWRERAAIVTLLLMADLESARNYLHRNAASFRGSASPACSPLYRAVEALPDDFDPHGPTVEFMAILRDACGADLVDVGNAGDGDKPLALLYRRFTRQFDLAEKFFPGDNSRPEVVQHRQQYKTAAGNTWRIVELLLRPDDPNERWRIVHRAVQVETPPDLLRYIVETNAEDLTVPDASGNLPLHYAAKSKPPAGDVKTNYPAFYTKYVVDELLYKFPEAAAMPNAAGNFPLTLAVKAGKQWIGGGIKSLYDAHPQALKQIDLQEHPGLRRVLSDWDDASASALGPNATSKSPNSATGGNNNGGSNDLLALSKEEKDDAVVTASSVIRDEQHDAIMLVQQPDVDVSEVVASMWAHEEDAGVQMLGCVAISRLVKQATNDESEILRIALSAVAGVVNAMKAHPNEVIVQEKACHALKLLARTDGQREVSFVASGSVAAIVGAMQAHVSDPGVQEEACGALAAITRHGGADRATIVASVSGMTAIINALAAHPEVAGVQHYGCLSLQELTEHPEEANLPELPRSQTEPLLQAAKRRFPRECGPAVDAVLQRLAAS